jgi:hypothetical protein
MAQLSLQEVKQQLDKVYGFEKKGESAAGVSDAVKWETVFGSTNDKVSGNGLYISQSLLHHGQGFDIIVQLLKSQNANAALGAVKALTNFSKDERVYNEVVKLNAMPAVVELLSKTTDISSVVRFCVNFMSREQSADLFKKNGGLEALAQILPKVVKEKDTLHLAVLLFNNLMIFSAKDLKSFAKVKIYEGLAAVLKEPQVDEKTLETMIRVLVNFSNDDANRKVLMEVGMIGPLLELLPRVKDPQLQETSRLFVANLINDEQAAVAIIKSGAFPSIVTGLDSTIDSVQSSSLSSIINLSVKDETMRLVQADALKSPLFEKLNALLKSSTDKVKYRAIWAISNLISNDTMQDLFVSKGGVVALINLLKESFGDKPALEEVRLKIMTAIFHLTLYSDDVRKQVVANGAIKVIVPVAQSYPNPDVKSEALKALINLALTEENEEAFIESKAVPMLVATLKTGDAAQKELACLTLENLCLSKKVNEDIRVHGGLDAAMSLVNGKESDELKERGGMLLAKLALNSKVRQYFQEKSLAALNSLKTMADTSKNAQVNFALSTAFQNLSVQHFETAQAQIEKLQEKDEFADYQAYLEKDDEDEDEDEESSSEEATVAPVAAKPEPVKTEVKVEKKPEPVKAVEPVKTVTEQPKAEPKVEKKPEVKEQPKVEVKTEVKVEKKPEPTKPVETKPEPKKDEKTETKVETKLDVKEPVATKPQETKVDQAKPEPVKTETPKVEAKTEPQKDDTKKPEEPKKVEDKSTSSQPKTESPKETPAQKPAEVQQQTTTTQPKQDTRPAVDPKYLREDTIENRGLSKDKYDVSDEEPAPAPQTAAEGSKDKKHKRDKKQKDKDKKEKHKDKKKEKKTKRDIKKLDPNTLVLERTDLPKIPEAPKTVTSPVTTPSTPATQAAQLPNNLDPVKLEQAKRQYRRTLIAQEILDTEASYVKNLAILVKKYQNPLLSALKSAAPILNEQEIRQIFSNVSILHSYNVMLLEGLNNRMSAWSSKQLMGDVFLAMTAFFKSYSTYINNYESAHQITTQAMAKNIRFKRFAEQVRDNPICNDQDIDSLLIMPVQRMPRYAMLIRELIKYTDKDHPDYGNLDKALKNIEEVTAYLNEKKREAVFMQQLVEATKNIFGCKEELVQPARILLKELKASFSAGKGKPKEGMLFLFNDALLYTHYKAALQKQYFKKIFKNNKYSLTPVEDKLVHLTVEGKAKPITLHLHSPKERDDLIVAYAKANAPVAKK